LSRDETEKIVGYQEGIVVVTPWGDSTALRARRLPPGPGTAAEDVARNQRERLFAAMVASVAERGYAATRVNDVVALSGVSTRSFYKLFDDKEDLFLATIDTILAETGELILAAAEGKPDAITAAVERTAEILVEHPITARVCLVDSLAAGPRVNARLAEATARFEALVTGVAANHFSHTPPELFTAWVGGLFELTRTRLLRGAEAEIPGVFADFVAIFRSYEPPAKPLRHTARQPAPFNGSIEGHDHAARAIRAFALVLAERGYAEATVEETLREASMSTKTFYANFAGKEDVLLAAIETAGARAMAATMLAFRRTDEWPPAVRAGLGAFFNFLAYRPELATVLLSEYAGGGAEAIRCRAEVLRPLERFLDGGLRRDPTMPQVVREVMVSCVLALAARVLSERGAAALPALAPICTHLILTPFIGTVAASEIANGDGRSRNHPEMLEAVKRLVANPLSARIVYLLNERGGEVPLPAIVAALDRPEEEIRRELEFLETAGHAEAVESTDGEPLYRSRMPYIDDDDWMRMEEDERVRISTRILEMMRAELTAATESGSFDARTDRYLVRLRGLVDEQGWAELGRIYDEATHAAMRTMEEAEKRVLESGEKAIDMSGHLVLFEMPTDR
jgi:AcrR family transcriptional regulator